MKRKNISFMTLFILTASLVGGCSCSKGSNENVSELVIKVGNKEYSAKELYNELLSTGTGANEAFAKVLRAVVESSVETHPNIQAAADLAAESLEEDVTNDAAANGTSKEDSRKKLLEEKGYTSVEEMKADIIYEQKLKRITENYWEESKAKYFDAYVENRLPYLIRHVLVKISDSNGNKISNNVTVSKENAKKLYDVIKRFEAGDKFSYVANQESDDTGSTAAGGAYYMDITSGANGFVDEFVYGTYAFDAYTTKVVEEGTGKTLRYDYGATDKVGKLKGLSDTDTFSEYYANGFNFVDMSIVNTLGKVYDQTSYSDKDYFQIGAVVDEEGKTADGNINSTENYYARSIIFNRSFNKPGVSVVGYSNLNDIPEGVTNYVELKISDTESKYILTDENKHPIFFVAARGSGDAIWVHFLTINVSTLDNLSEGKKFFSLTPDTSDTYTSYIDLMNTAGTTQGANKVINEIESYIKSYVTGGLGDKVGEENILKYDMVQHYLGENEIEFVDKELETAIMSYITNKKTLLETKLVNTLSEDWDTHTNKLEYNISKFNQRGVKPFECAVLAGDVEAIDNPYTALLNSDYLCRYVYGKGYQVQLNYNYKNSTTSDTYTKISTNTSNRAWFDNAEDYTQWVTIGSTTSKKIILPEPKVKTGYLFEGWFTNKALTKEVAKDTDGKYYIDLSESKITNSTIFFAKIVEDTATTITYKYQYQNGTTVGSDVVIENQNETSKIYSSEANNTITFDGEKISSDSVEFVSFKTSGGSSINELTITEADMGQRKEIIVVVKPKATTFVYKIVEKTGDEPTYTPVAENPKTTPPTSVVYNTGGSGNDITFDLSEFTWAEEFGTVTPVEDSIEFSRKSLEDSEYGDSDNQNVLTLTEQDMGKTIVVLVVVTVTPAQ